MNFFKLKWDLKKLKSPKLEVPRIRQRISIFQGRQNKFPANPEFAVSPQVVVQHNKLIEKACSVDFEMQLDFISFQ